MSQILDLYHRILDFNFGSLWKTNITSISNCRDKNFRIATIVISTLPDLMNGIIFDCNASFFDSCSV